MSEWLHRKMKYFSIIFKLFFHYLEFQLDSVSANQFKRLQALEAVIENQFWVIEKLISELLIHRKLSCYKNEVNKVLVEYVLFFLLRLKNENKVFINLILLLKP